ncbi:hypothetical protein [Sphingorhabdus sp. 109]|jgi:hypothetical protein|uniref:hypothetical protein n=1 Tax=Sphingorhabdus sp. 109 TaxID=2653173 RepID=UPI0012F2762D|nr:hypothetical protein [Sphingorhabdus sp. 109]VWX56569.1 conserved hypothetical protein [Sphingorhabdus sp. 109]
MLTLFLSLALAGDASAAASDERSAKEDKVVCRSEAVLGSKIPERICRTTREWKQYEEESARQLENRSSYSRGTQNRNDP